MANCWLRAESVTLYRQSEFLGHVILAAIISAANIFSRVHDLEGRMRNHRSMKPSTGMVSPYVPIIATGLFALFVLVLLMEARSWSTILN